MRRLAELADKERRRVVGLMSGTSADGIDAVLVDLWGYGESTRYEVLAFNTTPLPKRPAARGVRPVSPKMRRSTRCAGSTLSSGEAFATASPMQ